MLRPWGEPYQGIVVQSGLFTVVETAGWGSGLLKPVVARDVARGVVRCRRGRCPNNLVEERDSPGSEEGSPDLKYSAAG